LIAPLKLPPSMLVVAPIALVRTPAPASLKMSRYFH